MYFRRRKRKEEGQKRENDTKYTCIRIHTASGTEYVVPGTEYLVAGTRYQVPDT